MSVLLLILIAVASSQDLECLQGACNRVVLNEMKPLMLKCVHSNIRFIDLAVTTIPYGAFRVCSKTRVLDFSNNQIHEIRSTAFIGLHLLTDMYLSYNQIREIEPGTFHPLIRLEILVLTGNLLTTLPQMEITSKYMRYLNCYSNRMINIPENILKKLKILELLDLSNNNLVEISTKALINVEGGCTINLCNNLLTNIAFEIASTYAKGSTTFLASGNRIENITRRSLGTLHNLKIVCLDLSFNRIDFIESNVFNSYIHLQDLYLSNNKLRKLPTYLFQHLNKLTSIDLSHNRFKNNIFNFYYPKSVRYLNYSHNQIAYIDDFSWIPDGGYIQELNLMSNKITFLDVNIVTNQIKSISLVYNDWECSVLYTLLTNLESRGIKVIRMHDERSLHVNGISCKIQQELYDDIQDVPKKDFKRSKIIQQKLVQNEKPKKIYHKVSSISFVIIILLIFPFIF